MEQGDTAQSEQAFSEDGGKIREVNWIIRLATGSKQIGDLTFEL
jgi:hypothetical protein